MSSEETTVISRREFVSRLGAGAATLTVVGFDPIARRWVTKAEAASCPSFAGAPRLDGTLAFDASALASNSRDLGRIVFQSPCAVLRPGSVADIQAMIRYCREHAIKVAPTGAHHAMFGQALVGSGLVIEMRSLAQIHSIGPEGADVDAGVLWKDLIVQAFHQRLTPASITGYVKTTVGGTLSMGGIGVMSTYRAGAQVDHVKRLDVVTGRGDLVRCSSTENSDLFHAVLAGLGQCGVITRATVGLVPAKPMASTFRIIYPNISTFFRDTRILANRGEFDSLGTIPLPGTAVPFTLWATIFHDLASPPNPLRLLRGLSPLALTATVTPLPYLAYVDLVTDLYDTFKLAGWENKVKPWLDLFLPDTEVEAFVTSVVPTLGLTDVGPTGFVLAFPMLRASYTRPLLRLPREKWVWLFSILTESIGSGPDEAFASRMLERNLRLYRDAFAVGGLRYPHGACRFTQQDWREHYGPVWSDFQSWKARFDPSGILTPGPEIF